ISIYLIDEYSYDLHHEDVDQLYQVATVLKRTDGDITTGSTPYGLADLLINEYPEIEQTTRMVGLFVDDKTLLSYTEGDNTNTFYETKGYLTDKSFFDLFNYDFVEGNAEMALEKPNSIVLSEDIANRIFGKLSALNKTLKVESNTNGSGEYIITGVFKPSGHPTHHDGRFFMSFEGGALHQYTKNNPGLAGNNFMFTYIKLKESASADALESKFPAFVQKYMAEDLSKAGFSKEQFLLPVKDIHLDSGMESNVTPTGDKTQLFVLFSIAIFILLIACINYMNLSTARSSKRAAEVGVRKVLGASKNGLVKQFLSESILMAVLSFLLAVVIVLALWQPFETISGKNFTFSLSQLFVLGGLFLAVSLIAGILAGSYPAFFLSSFRPVKVLKGRVSNSLAAVSLRKVLVVFQFTIAIVLIVASVVVFNQMSFLSTKDLGFAKSHRIVVPLRTQDAKKSYSILKDKLENSIHVEAVGAAAYYPGIFNPEDAVFYTEGSNMDLGKHLFINRIDDEFLKTLNIDVVAGRGFSEKFADSSTIIVNQTAIKEFDFPNEEAAIGKSIFTEIQGNLYSREIVGVVKDFHFQDLRSPITPFAFTAEDDNYNYLIANINGKNVNEALSTLE
ncbi:MAG: ABC transporter permease, partial [Flavobacteriaceae bacterium]|nr:ABC transporter permease [Flavobacteriaceae bacterium]